MSNTKTNPKNSSKAVQVAETQTVPEKANDWSISKEISSMINKAIDQANKTEYGHIMTEPLIKETLKICEDQVRAEHPEYNWQQINGAMSFYAEHIASELLSRICQSFKALNR
jgi:hypothetical protein